MSDFRCHNFSVPICKFVRPLHEEIAKNLALSGIGKLSIAEISNFSGPSLRGEDPTLAQYIKNLNPLVDVRYIMNFVVY